MQIAKLQDCKLNKGFHNFAIVQFAIYNLDEVIL